MKEFSKKEQLEQVVSGVFAASIKLNRIAEELLNNSQYNIGCTALSVMVSIRRSENHITVPQIAEKYLISRQAVQRQVTQLMEEGLIEKCENPNHKRSSFYVLTEKGETTLDAIFMDVFDPWMNGLVKKYDHIDLSGVLTVLNEVTHF